MRSLVIRFGENFFASSKLKIRRGTTSIDNVLASRVKTVMVTVSDRHNDLIDPLWNLLDTTPEGRGKFEPKLAY